MNPECLNPERPKMVKKSYNQQLDYADKKGTQQMKAYLWMMWCHNMSNVFD